MTLKKLTGAQLWEVRSMIVDIIHNDRLRPLSEKMIRCFHEIDAELRERRADEESKT